MKKSILVFSILIFVGIFYFWVQESRANNEKLHLVALGDSITYGTGDPTKSGYIERVRTRLTMDMNLPVKLTNFGIPRYTTSDILIQLEDKKVLERLKQANYITLYVGTNDFRLSANFNFDLLDAQRMRNGKKQFSENLHSILRIVKDQNSDAPIFVLGLYHPYVEYKNNQEIATELEAWNQSIMKTVDAFEKTIYVPTIDLFENQPKDQFFSDAIHLNPSGYQLIAERLFNEIRNYDSVYGNRQTNRARNRK